MSECGVPNPQESSFNPGNPSGVCKFSTAEKGVHSRREASTFTRISSSGSDAAAEAFMDKMSPFGGGSAGAKCPLLSLYTEIE